MSELEQDRHAVWFELAIDQARKGDREMAEHLVREFAQLAKNPKAFDAVGGVPEALIQYIATCLADWQKLDFKDAEHWFNVAKPANAPKKSGALYVDAMRAYMLLRARYGKARAIDGAAAYTGLTEGQVRHLIESDKPESAPWYEGPSLGEVQAAALMLIMPRLHDRVLNPPRKKQLRSR